MRLFILVLIPFFAHAGPEIKDAKRSVEVLIRPLLGNNSKGRPFGTEKFRVDRCDKKVNWEDLVSMRMETTLHYKFQEGCDIEGTISPKLFQFFPANLKLRNIQSYSSIQGQNRINADLQSKPILNLEVRQGVLSGKHQIKFEVDYRVQINPLQKNPVDKNLGGELRISEIDGKKTSIREKILIK